MSEKSSLHLSFSLMRRCAGIAKKPSRAKVRACVSAENLWKISPALQAAAFVKATTESVVDFSRASDIRDNYRFSRGSWTNRAVALESPFLFEPPPLPSLGTFSERPLERGKASRRLIKRARYHYLEPDFHRRVSWRSRIFTRDFNRGI